MPVKNKKPIQTNLLDLIKETIKQEAKNAVLENRDMAIMDFSNLKRMINGQEIISSKKMETKCFDNTLSKSLKPDELFEKLIL